MAAKPKQALGRGLSSLIPQKKKSPTADDTSTDRSGDSSGVSILEISLTSIRENPRQPRREFSENELQDLAESIREHGILQPLVVTCVDDDQYELIAGERRMRAAKRAQLKQVPVVVREVNDQEKLELALIENIQRQDLNPVEEAIAYQALLEEFNLTQKEVAKRVGKSRSAVANMLRLLDLSEQILDALRAGKLSKSHARTLLSESDEQKRMAMFAQMVKGEMSVRQAEESVRRKRGTGKKQPKDPNLQAQEKQLRELFGTKVRIKERGGKGELRIEYYSREELRKILDIIAS